MNANPLLQSWHLHNALRREWEVLRLVTEIQAALLKALGKP